MPDKIDSLRAKAQETASWIRSLLVDSKNGPSLPPPYFQPLKLHLENVLNEFHVALFESEDIWTVPGKETMFGDYWQLRDLLNVDFESTTIRPTPEMGLVYKLSKEGKSTTKIAEILFEQGAAKNRESSETIQQWVAVTQAYWKEWEQSTNRLDVPFQHVANLMEPPSGVLSLLTCLDSLSGKLGTTTTPSIDPEDSQDIDPNEDKRIHDEWRAARTEDADSLT